MPFNNISLQIFTEFVECISPCEDELSELCTKDYKLTANHAEKTHVLANTMANMNKVHRGRARLDQ